MQVKQPYGQRQVRRRSDTGIRQLAITIATNWSTVSVPTLGFALTL